MGGEEEEEGDSYIVCSSSCIMRSSNVGVRRACVCV